MLHNKENILNEIARLNLLNLDYIETLRQTSDLFFVWDSLGVYIEHEGKILDGPFALGPIA